MHRNMSMWGASVEEGVSLIEEDGVGDGDGGGGGGGDGDGRGGGFCRRPGILDPIC